MGIYHLRTTPTKETNKKSDGVNDDEDRDLQQGRLVQFLNCSHTTPTTGNYEF